MAATAAVEQVINLVDPYPVPAVGTATIERAYGQLLGINVNSKDSRVMVSSLRPDSILRQTDIQVSDEILAINGIAVHDAQQAADILKAYTKLQITTLKAATRARMPTFCYVEVAPTTKINPGISFDSCCNRTMVMIGDMFIPSRQTNLNKGDIVLAVNGVPVWKPEEADNAQLLATRDAKALVLYCVDMDSMRKFLASKAQKTHLYGGDYRTARIGKLPTGRFLIQERDCRCIAEINKATQLFEDKTEVNHQYKDHMVKKISYEKVCLQTLNSINDLMRTQLHTLKKKIVAKAWEYSIKKSEDSIPTYCVPSAPMAVMEIADSDSGNDEYPVANAVVIDGNAGGQYEL